MLWTFFHVAMTAWDRQRAFRQATVIHLTLIIAFAAVLWRNPNALPIVGQSVLVIVIIEGAMLIGWRLTQMPKSQALEFLLASPVNPKCVFYLEAAVGISRFLLIVLSGLPILILLGIWGRLTWDDIVVLTVMPLSWGTLVGLGLTTWAYESQSVRRVGESFCLVGVVAYLVIGVLAGENLRQWLAWLHESARWWFLELFGHFHTDNPFATLQYWLDPHRIPEVAWERTFGLELMALGIIGLVAMRSACRLSGHFHDRHYRPIGEVTPDTVGDIGERPLTWWAVRRVMEYSGRVNLWLAGGFGAAYAAYTVAGDCWPPWLGRLVFRIVENSGGIPVLAAGMAILAAVPACFQYGLWDSSVQSRCRRLELLLLTGLNGGDYWDAAAAAAWRRGRGYFAIAVLLWLAAVVAGQATAIQALVGMAAAVVLWGLYFAIGFWSFAGGRHANGLGSFLALGLPFATFAIARSGWPELGALTPPGAVHYALTPKADSLMWLPGTVFSGLLALILGTWARQRCDRGLRTWYDQNSGVQIAN